MIRLAKPWDIKGILRLLAQIADLHRQNRPDIFKETGEKYTQSELEQMLADETAPIFVAVNNQNKVLGYCFCNTRKTDHPMLKETKRLHIDDFCVDTAMQGKGIGKKLFARVLEFAQTQQITQIELNVWAFNENAIKFYENLGFAAQRVKMERNL
ncbi:MAG: GNAT family N-acetyltransferase [Defluviitaleaceae bacterium]|nr:GNAT family N-acetyltransferase [Defluviitaleaceae bacterium]